MTQKLATIACGLVVGLLIGFFFVSNTPLLQAVSKQNKSAKQVIGFLPYWLIGKANSDYSHDISTLAYFSLALDDDGSIRKLSNPQEEDPGWYTLSSGKFDMFLSTAKADKTTLSLVVFSADEDVLGEVLSDPITHADNLTGDAISIMKKYGFTDLNLDMEYRGEASPSATAAFSRFLRQVKTRLAGEKKFTLTVEISPADLIRHGMTDLKSVGKIADHVILMTYDYSDAGSMVTEPVAPLNGAGVTREYDVQTAVQRALTAIPSSKIILGIPLYGYEWETIATASHSAVIPGTGEIASNRRIEDLLHTCASCSAHLDTDAEESYLVYKDVQTGTYHQITFPDQQAITAKITYALQEKLGGIALWALGYEGSTELTPFAAYKK